MSTVQISGLNFDDILDTITNYIKEIQEGLNNDGNLQHKYLNLNERQVAYDKIVRLERLYEAIRDEAEHAWDE